MNSIIKFEKKEKPDLKGQLGLNRWPLDLQSNALPLSYAPLNTGCKENLDGG